MGLSGVAEAITLAGEFTVVPSPGLEIVSGKSELGGGGGSCAGGAGSELVPGDHVGGVGDGEGDGEGEGVGLGDGVGLGVGCGATGVGVGLGVGAGPVVVVLAAPPAHPAT